MIEEVRHDFVTKAKVDSYEDIREESSIPNVVEQVEEEENSVDGIVEYVPSEVEASSYYTKRPSTIMENVLQGLSCGGILTCQGDEDESQSEVEQEEESRGKSTAETVAETVDQTIAETVDQNVESDLKMAVETVRCELDVGAQQSKQSSISYENESEDASHTVGTPSAGVPTVGASTVGSFTVETKTVDIDDFVALPTAEEDTAEESTVPSRKDSRSPTFIYEEDVSVFEKGRKQERQQYESSCDDSFTAFDNLTAYTEDVTTAFGTRFDESTFMGGNVFM